jgi:hypothetical protein
MLTNPFLVFPFSRGFVYFLINVTFVKLVIDVTRTGVFIFPVIETHAPQLLEGEPHPQLMKDISTHSYYLSLVGFFLDYGLLSKEVYQFPL